MSDDNSKVIAIRAQEPPKKNSYILSIVGTCLSFLVGIATLIIYFLENVNSFLYIAIVFLALGVFLGAFIPLSVKNYKRCLKELEYPKEAIKLVGNDEIEIFTDKSEVIKFSEIDKVVGSNISVTTSYGFVLKQTSYTYGPMEIRLKDGRKINLFNIQNVNQVVKVLNSLKR